MRSRLDNTVDNTSSKRYLNKIGAHEKNENAGIQTKFLINVYERIRSPIAFGTVIESRDYIEEY